VKPLDDRGNDIAPLDHRTYAHIAASEALRNGTNDVIPDHLADRSYVLGRQRVLVHERVHGRIDERRRRGRQRAQQRCLFSFMIIKKIYSFIFFDDGGVEKVALGWADAVRCDEWEKKTRRARKDG